jgi:cytochrome c biogenesis protein CcdA
MNPKHKFIASIAVIFILCGLAVGIALLLPANWSEQARTFAGFFAVLPLMLVVFFYARRQRAQLPQKSSKDLNKTVYVGLVLHMVGVEMGEAGMNEIAMITVAIGLPVFIWGCTQYSKAKGYSAWLGALGLLSLLGLWVLMGIPDRSEKAG